jgi:hypothetical protein
VGLLQGAYGPEWRAHVLSHLPFYTILLPEFVELCYGRVAYRADVAVRDLYNILKELQAAPELVELLEEVENEYNK